MSNTSPASILFVYHTLIIICDINKPIALLPTPILEKTPISTRILHRTALFKIVDLTKSNPTGVCQITKIEQSPRGKQDGEDHLEDADCQGTVQVP